MKLSVGNKQLQSKPSTQQEKSQYFKGLKFKTEDFDKDKIKEIIENGFTITYLYKDDEFGRTNHYMSKHYLGTQFICVDIDRCDMPPEEFDAVLNWLRRSKVLQNAAAQSMRGKRKMTHGTGKRKKR